MVEDFFDLRSLTADFLRTNGYRVIEAINSVEAISVLSSGTAVDLVFTDVYMPGGWDGFALAEWIAQQCPHVSVLITSARVDEENRAAACARAFVRKPYDPVMLLQKIELLLQR